MSLQLKLLPPLLALALCTATDLKAQNKSSHPGDGDRTLQYEYDAAQRSQQSGDLNRAATQYRHFLADVLGRLAVGHAHIGDYSRAASFFDESLALEGNAPSLRLEYARTALLHGDVDHAQTLASAFLREFSSDRQGSAQAHQILGRALLRMNRDKDARKELETAVELDPTFENGYDLAVVCLDLDDQKCAAQVFSEMESAFGDTAALHMHFGEAYGDSDFQPQAIDEFRKVIAEAPRAPGAHYSLAAALLATGEDDVRVREAESELKKELSISPRDFLSYAALGKLAAAHHHDPEAEEYLKKAISLNPKSPDAFLYLGQMYSDAGRTAEAEAMLRSAIDLTTDPARNHYQVQKAHFLLGRLLMQEHHEQEAHAEMQTAHALANQALSQDKGKLAGLLADNAASLTPSANPTQAASAPTGDADPAAVRTLADFEKQLTPAIADSYNNLGAVAAGSGNYDFALQLFTRAAEWNPSLEGLDYNWGRAAFMASRFHEAIAPLSRYARAHRDDKSVGGPLAMSQFMTGNYSGCIAALEGVDEKTAAIPQMQYILAESLVKTGQVPAGKARFEALATTHPEIPDVHRGLAEALASQGDDGHAVDELHATLAIAPNDAEAHFMLGEIELRRVHLQPAIAELESAVRLNPREPRFHRRLADAYTRANRAADAEKELHILNSLETASEPQTGANAQSPAEKSGPR